jgi:pimeloyl-ACP methyl ester carboxylesterase
MNTPASAFRERRVTTGDGLSLYVRDYGDPASTATPVLCLSGLTRNSRDFHAFATRLAPQRRVLAMDYRGRGQSDYDPVVTNYRPDVYANDAIKVAADSGIERVVLVGTSLGGIVTMVLAALKPGFMTGAVLNDIGPEIPAEAAARIGSYTGIKVQVASMDDAVKSVKERYAGAYPGLADDRWRAMAEDVFMHDPDGSFRPAYDLGIARAFAETGRPAAADMWPLFLALKDIPVLAIRGALSDVLTAETFDKMQAAKPDLMRVTVPNRGHIPLLDEPECLAGFDRFFARV